MCLLWQMMGCFPSFLLVLGTGKMAGFGVLELLEVTIQLFVGFNGFQKAKAENSLVN